MRLGGGVVVVGWVYEGRGKKKSQIKFEFRSVKGGFGGTKNDY